MARKSNQQIRREELIDAAQDAVARKGLAAVQLRDIAQLAELTPGAILYYYDDLHDLLRQVYERATQRYSVAREQAIAEISSPALQLGTLLQMSAPSGPDDTELRILFEFDAMIFRNPRYIEYARQYLHRQVEMYRTVLQGGRRRRSVRVARVRNGHRSQPPRTRGLTRVQRSDRRAHHRRHVAAPL